MENQTIRDLLRELEEDSTSGASEFIERALEIVKFQLRLILDPHKDITEEITSLMKQIVDARPSIAPLINTIGYLIHDLERLNKRILEERLNHFNLEKRKRIEALELNFHTFLMEHRRDPLKVMLISYSSTIMNLLLKNKEFNLEIFVLESRPLLEGHRVAEILSSYFKTHLIIDAAIGNFIDEIDMVLIGVDSILKNGSVINKIGTFPLSLLAITTKKEVYAVCDSYKYNLKSHYGHTIKIEEKPVIEIYNKEIKDDFLEIHNYYFDITPSKYISGIISDIGVLTIEEFLERVRNILPIEWFKYFLNNKMR